MKISTHHIYPPIPLRQYDWLAYVDPEFGPFGHGATEAEAIADLEETILTSGIEPLVHGLVVDEFLALAMDEGQNSSNAWRLHEHMQHGLNNLANKVEGVLIRHSVVEAA